MHILATIVLSLSGDLLAKSLGVMSIKCILLLMKEQNLFQNPEIGPKKSG